MPFSIFNPYVILAIIAAGAGIFFYGHHKGVADTESKQKDAVIQQYQDNVKQINQYVGDLGQVTGKINDAAAELSKSKAQRGATSQHISSLGSQVIQNDATLSKCKFSDDLVRMWNYANSGQRPDPTIPANPASGSATTMPSPTNPAKR